VFYTTFTFWFHLFRSADKIYEDDTVVHLVLPPPHLCNVTARAILILGHSTYTDLPLSPTHPAFLLAGAAAHYPRPAFLLAGAAANYGSICGHVFVRWRERGGPGITSLHVGWQRAERILVLVILMPHMENGQG
jgi:hypothetical protein